MDAYNKPHRAIKVSESFDYGQEYLPEFNTL